MTKFNFRPIFFLSYFALLVNANPPLQKKAKPTLLQADDLLVEYARHYAKSIQMFKRTKEHRHLPRNIYPLAPFTLYPTRFPRKMFDQAETLQPAMNLLYFRASRDYEFLRDALGALSKTSRVVRTMLDIIGEVTREGGYRRQPISVAVQRADYMCHVSKDAQNNEHYELKQVEVNNGAPGGPPMARRMTMVHRKLLSQLGRNASLEVLRDNRPYKTMAEAMYFAWLTFGDPKSIMILVQMDGLPKETLRHQTELFDMERELERISSGQLQYVHLGMEQCEDRLILNSDDFSLRLDDGRLVAIVYHRLLPIRNTVKAWRARLMIERSTAIKAPSMGSDLTSLKMVQQALAQPGNVERFFTDPEETHYVQAIRKVFTGLWNLDSDHDQHDGETKMRIEDAIAHPENYVLKPMKEGGGHNFFGADVAEKLKTFTPEERHAHILMQRLQPMGFQNYMIKPFDEPKFGDMVTEFSTFGSLVGNIQEGTVLYNQAHGYLMRSKWADSNEGGILFGAGAYDTPYLY